MSAADWLIVKLLFQSYRICPKKQGNFYTLALAFLGKEKYDQKLSKVNGVVRLLSK